MVSFAAAQEYNPFLTKKATDIPGYLPLAI
jgi:hypothetical protein